MFPRRRIPGVPFGIGTLPQVQPLRPLAGPDVLVAVAVLSVHVLDVRIAHENPSSLAAVGIPGRGLVLGQLMESNVAPEDLAPVGAQLGDLPAVLGPLGAKVDITQVPGQGLGDNYGRDHHLLRLYPGAVGKLDPGGASVLHQNLIHVRADEELAPLLAKRPLEGMDGVVSPAFVDGSPEADHLHGHLGQHNRQWGRIVRINAGGAEHSQRMGPQLVALEQVADVLGSRHELVPSIDTRVGVLNQRLNRIELTRQSRRVKQNVLGRKAPFPDFRGLPLRQPLRVSRRDPLHLLDVPLHHILKRSHHPRFLVPLERAIGDYAPFVREHHGRIHTREDVVQAPLMKLEVLVHRTRPEPGHVGTGVPEESRYRPRLRAAATAQLPPLLKQADRVAVPHHVICGDQPLMATPHYYNIKALICHWYLLWLDSI